MIISQLNNYRRSVAAKWTPRTINDEIWYPSEEWIHDCVRYDEKEDLSHPHETQWVNYHLTDCIQDCKKCTISIDASPLGKMSIAGMYWLNACHQEEGNSSRGNDVEYLSELFQLYKQDLHPYLAPLDVPNETDVVLYLPLGDEKEKPLFLADKDVGPFEMLRFGANDPYAGTIQSVNEYLKLFNTLGVRRVILRLPGSTHLPQPHPKFNVYLRCLVQAFETAGFVTIDPNTRKEHDPDQDFYYMSHARYFVPDTSRYSQTISQMVNRLGGKAIHIKTNGTVGESIQYSRNKTNNYLLYLTTLFSEQHQQIFRYCWPEYMRKSKFLQGADIIIFSNNITEVDNSIISFVRDLFSKNPSFRFEFASDEMLLDMAKPSRRSSWMSDFSRNRFQFGANEAVSLGFAKKWFLEYSWIIRTNPDVFIRNSSWILATIHDPTVDGIFVQCHPSKIHTDFFAVRPYACRSNAFYEMVVETRNIANHERTASKEFQHIILANRHRWLPGTRRSGGLCRVRGVHSPVVHEHDAIQVAANGTLSCQKITYFDNL